MSALDISRTDSGNVEPGRPVMFDTETLVPEGIEYDSDTGLITFNETGNYLVNWWVATETAPTGVIEFALSTSNGNYHILGSSPTKTGQLSGYGSIDVISAPTTLSLINATGHSIMFSRSTQVKAHLLITKAEEGKEGPQGEPGPAGPQGPTGPTATTIYAQPQKPLLHWVFKPTKIIA